MSTAEGVPAQSGGSLFDETFARCTRPVSGDAPMEKTRRRITFTVDHTLCEPDTFTEDFELTIQSLSHGQELAAARGAEGSAVVMGSAYARSSIYAVNGRVLSRGKGEVDFLWEAIGSGGRNLVAQMFIRLSGVGDEAAKKAEDSIRFE